MKQIRINKSKDFQIGNVRVDKSLYDKIHKVSKVLKVSPQVVVRAILENFIDEVTFVE